MQLASRGSDAANVAAPALFVPSSAAVFTRRMASWTLFYDVSVRFFSSFLPRVACTARSACGSSAVSNSGKRWKSGQAHILMLAFDLMGLNPAVVPSQT